MINIDKLLESLKISKKGEKFLLNLSRKTLKYYFKNRKQLTPRDVKLPPNLVHELAKEIATFVTLEKKNFNGKYVLRGCIGHLLPIKPLYMDVMENTYAAAFNDPRFPPLAEKELKRIKIEISLLSSMFRVQYGGIDELIDALQQYKPGVVLSLYGRHATFLPQVWEEIPSAKDFLSSLCVKAGLPSDCWTKNRPEIHIYFVHKIREE